MNTLQAYRQAVANLAEARGLLNEKIEVEVKPLSTRQAIGTPDRDDFPLLKGKERIVEARYQDSPGQAFTDAFQGYQGTIASLLAMDLEDRFNAAIFTASANAVLRHLGLTQGTVHCKDGEPTRCASSLAPYLKERHPQVRRVTLVGLQPALAEALAPAYELSILDLDPENLGRKVAGVTVQDGRQELAQAVDSCDLVLATGSTLTNQTLDKVLAAAGPKPVVWFGITISGAASLLGLERYCPLGR